MNDIKDDAPATEIGQEASPPQWSDGTQQLIWTITWTKAFPTLLPQQVYYTNDAPQSFSSAATWQKLAFDSIFSLAIDHVTNRTSMASNGFMNDRDQESMENSLGYGEITPESVMRIMAVLQEMNVLNRRIIPASSLEESPVLSSNHSDTKAETIDTIIDLGSGNGRVLFAASLCCHPMVRRAIGLEILESLHAEAVRNLELWHRQQQQQQQHTTSDTVFDLRCADFTQHANTIVATRALIFIHATVFNDALMQKLQNICERCQGGTVFICVSKCLEATMRSGIQTLRKLQLEMNWGEATVYVQRKQMKRQTTFGQQ
mmetsp:Transcript_16545/g.46260  ORF Transcript_16545/g.46260 Transcript_16545/m.46260 type:complete len:317 (+) Transcript_16545:23-973(+)